MALVSGAKTVKSRFGRKNKNVSPMGLSIELGGLRLGQKGVC